MKFINAIVAAAVLAASAVTAKETIEICRNNLLVFCEINAPAWNRDCVELGVEYDNLVSSFDTRGLTCEFYDEPGCSKDTAWFEHTGKMPALNAAPAGKEGWDDRISSYKCKAPQEER
ncbi:uncharacterized protein L3040_008749 [Drepanopeziza brunnea f. sp. 'multigermtubi']|uniref:uncharacterized protein n=1 Tax=Drepanopeziza brunnea f. sp. 'multigermtubi' TaxID=698441 RepID=UPI00238BCC94|nr:hypothetical protein L3040_008749 [Drepanopeziza brunnea f. sp. 'multigermtubi']